MLATTDEGFYGILVPTQLLVAILIAVERSNYELTKKTIVFLATSCYSNPELTKNLTYSYQDLRNSL